MRGENVQLMKRAAKTQNAVTMPAVLIQNLVWDVNVMMDLQAKVAFLRDFLFNKKKPNLIGKNPMWFIQKVCEREPYKNSQDFWEFLKKSQKWQENAQKWNILKNILSKLLTIIKNLKLS